MSTALVPLVSLLLSLVVLLAGHGLQLTLLPLHAGALGWTATEIGWTGSAYFIGFVLGCVTVPRLVSGVGHIRVYAVCAAAATAALLAAQLMPYLYAWMLLRLVTGWSLSGLYMVIESWLNEKSPPERRGMILALYTTLSLVAMMVGQLLIGVGDPTTSTPFLLGAVLLCLSIVPVGLTRASTPQPPHRVRFSLRKLYRSSNIAVIGAFGAGLVTGVFWTLGPLFASAAGYSTAEVGLFMTTVVLGGTLVQLPVGRLSDRFDRRFMVMGMTLFGAAVSTAFVFYFTMPLALLFGAATMPLYALCLALANDRVEDGEYVRIGTGILMTHSAGSMLGPLLAAPLMTAFGARALFIHSALCLIVIAAWAALRIRVRPAVSEHHEPFKVVTRTTQEVFELDPPAGPETAELHAAADGG